MCKLLSVYPGAPCPACPTTAPSPARPALAAGCLPWGGRRPLLLLSCHNVNNDNKL